MSRLSNVSASASAKVNIGWRVGPRRDDGYHDVEGLIQTIDLSDTLTIRSGEASGDLVAEVEGVDVGLTVAGPEASPDLVSSGNLVFKAVELLARIAKPAPVSIELHKEIPVGAGLGGGSADAAGVLFALGMAWGADVTAKELVRLGAEIGSDVPAILLGGLVHASGRGERVRRIGSATSGRFVLGFLPGRISAADAYRAFDGLETVPRNRFETNDLQAAAIELHPGVQPGLDAMRAAGATSVFVSGSGPTVVAACGDEHEAKAVADACAGVFRRVVVAGPSALGVKIGLRGRN